MEKADAKNEKPKRRPKPKPKPKLLDEERHERFVSMAHEVEADETPASFDRAFDKVVNDKKPPGVPRRP
jgi:hypothetical protein